MRGSATGDEPPELRDWKAEQRRNGIEPQYRDLQQPEKGATERSLFAEQTGQCVYCGRGISLEADKMIATLNLDHPELVVEGSLSATGSPARGRCFPRIIGTFR